MKSNRLAAMIVAAVLLLSGCAGTGQPVLIENQHSLAADPVSAASLTEGTKPWQGQEFCIPTEQQMAEDDKVSAVAALLVNLDKPEAVYAKNIYQAMNPASITTLFTAYVVLQNRELTDMVTVTAEEISGLTQASTIGLKVGDRLSVEQLLYGMLLSSGVDAANVLAVDTAGSIDAFVRMMNDAAFSCGCVDTQFKNPNGLSEWGHYTTAYDIYLLLHHLMKDERFVNILSTGTYHCTYQDNTGAVKETTYTTRVQFVADGLKKIGKNRILGGKTGTTSSAGHCLALICKGKSGDRYLALALKAKSKDSLYEQIEHIVKKIEK